MTETVWISWTSLPHKSVAMNRRSRTLSMGQEPTPFEVKIWMVMSSASVQLSVAVAPSKTNSLPHGSTKSSGMSKTGGVKSRTRMICSPDVEFPHKSVALNDRKTVYSPGQSPLTTTGSSSTTAKNPSQASTATASS